MCTALYGTAYMQALAIANYIYLASSGELIPTHMVCAYRLMLIYVYAYSLKLFIKCRLDEGDGQNCRALTEEAQYTIMSLVVNVMRINTHLKRTQKRFIIAY